MDQFLDTAWARMAGGLETAALAVDGLIRPLESFGPALVILVLALATVGVTRVFKRLFQTRRHARLEEEFKYWQSVREAAMKVADREKGKAMAKNIDQAQLNKAYYDYFFEGFMTHLFTTVLPILMTLAYLSRTYTKSGLAAKFGSPWVFTIGTKDPFNVGTLFWYIICIFLSFLLYGLGRRIFKGRKPS